MKEIRECSTENVVGDPILETRKMKMEFTSKINGENRNESNSLRVPGNDTNTTMKYNHESSTANVNPKLETRKMKTDNGENLCESNTLRVSGNHTNMDICPIVQRNKINDPSIVFVDPEKGPESPESRNESDMGLDNSTKDHISDIPRCHGLQDNMETTVEEPISKADGSKLEDKQQGNVVMETFSMESCEEEESTGRINLSTDLGQEHKDTKTAVNKRRKRKISRYLQCILSIYNGFLVALTNGFMFGLSVLFVAILDEFGATRAETSTIMSVFTCFLFAGGGVVGPLMNRYNGGYICMVGGVLGCIGCIISSFAPSIPYLIVGTGVLTGSALSFSFALPYITIRDIFDKHRTNMLTVMGVSPGIGTVIFPYLTSQLIDVYGWRGAFLIYASVILHCVPIGYLNAIVKRRYVRRAVVTRWRDVFNVSLFKQGRFLVMAFNALMLNTLFPNTTFFFVDMTRKKGFDVNTSSAILSISGFCNMAGRAIIVSVTPFIRLSRTVQWSVYMPVISVCVMGYIFATSYVQFLAIAITFGFFWGFTAVSYTAMILEVAGANQFASALGFCSLIGGVGGLICSPIAGAVKDLTGSYDLLYYSTSGLGLLACCLLVTASVQIHLEKRRADKFDNSQCIEISISVPEGNVNQSFQHEDICIDKMKTKKLQSSLTGI